MEFFGQVRENSGKDHSHPQNFACSYSYVLHHHRFRDFLECFGNVLVLLGMFWYLRAWVTNPSNIAQ